MINETLQMVTDALNHPTYGVNQQLSGSIFSDYSGSSVTAYDETRSDQLAMGQPQEPYPSLNVTLAEPANLQGEVHTSLRDGISVPMTIAYVGRNTSASAGVRDMWHTIRAVQYTLRDWLRNENEADRESNNVQVVSCTEITVVPNMVTDQDAIIPGGVSVGLYVRDVYGS